jgi:hypothetical protein
MDLMQFDGSEVVLRLDSSDCATLAQLLAVAAAELVAEPDESLKESASNYAALFRALSLGTVAPGRLMPWDLRSMPRNLPGAQFGDES